MSKIKSLRLENVGQIKKADISFGDLTVLVGPQATGKSIFLQFLKFAIDTVSVKSVLEIHGLDWQKDLSAFFDLFLGEGMRTVWNASQSKIIVNQTVKEPKKLLNKWAKTEESLFFIPAQRVITLRNGWPRPFGEYSPGDPYTVRHFSDQIRRELESKNDVIFPAPKRFKKEIRDMLAESIFGTFDLHVDRRYSQKRLVLGGSDSNTELPFMVWSAGQREFVPLLLGLSLLIPSGATPKSGTFEWVVIEEPEMGLHPNALSTVMTLVLELLSRGYKVCISTHSPHVLDIVWGIGAIQENRGSATDLLDMLGAPTSPNMQRMASKALDKKARVYYFDRNGITTDISRLDPGAEDDTESGWGGLSEFSGRVANVVARVVSSSRRRKRS